MTTEELIKQRKVDYLTWDWKEQIPIEEVGVAVKMGFVFMYPVDDTGGDFYALVISQVELDPDDIQPLFEKLEVEMDKESYDNQLYRTISLEIEVVNEQDSTPITEALVAAMASLEGPHEINDWRFVETTAYGKVEE